jgi:hypothetical protein
VIGRVRLARDDYRLTMWKDSSPIFSCRKVAADVMQLMRKDEGKEIFDKSLHPYNIAEGVGVKRAKLA